MPDTISSQHGGTYRGGLLDTDADRHQRQHVVAGDEGEDPRDGIEVGPGFDAHHLIAQGTRVDVDRHLPRVLGERRYLHLHAFVKHVGLAVEQALVVVLPHHRLQRVGIRRQHGLPLKGDQQQQDPDAHVDSSKRRSATGSVSRSARPGAA